MKARVKRTEKIVEVDYIEGDFLHTSDGLYLIAELEGIESDIDYWTRLEEWRCKGYWLVKNGKYPQEKGFLLQERSHCKLTNLPTPS